jgi:hypothetical protein
MHTTDGRHKRNEQRKITWEGLVQLAALGSIGTIKITLSISPVQLTALVRGSVGVFVEERQFVLILRFHSLHRYTPFSLFSLPASEISSSLGHVAGVALCPSQWVTGE